MLEGPDISINARREKCSGMVIIIAGTVQCSFRCSKGNTSQPEKSSLHDPFYAIKQQWE